MINLNTVIIKTEIKTNFTQEQVDQLISTGAKMYDKPKENDSNGYWTDDFGWYEFGIRSKGIFILTIQKYSWTNLLKFVTFDELIKKIKNK